MTFCCRCDHDRFGNHSRCSKDHNRVRIDGEDRFRGYRASPRRGSSSRRVPDHPTLPTQPSAALAAGWLAAGGPPPEAQALCR